MAGAIRQRVVLWLVAAVAALVLAPATAAAATASWAFEPVSYDFGVLMPGAEASAPVPFTLRNTGEVTLRPALVTLSSGGGGIFHFQNGCGAPLPPGATCTVGVTFRATSSGPKESTLEMSELNEAVPPAVAHLTGAGTAPTVTVDPTTIDFGTVPLGTNPPPSRTITVTNSGLLELTMNGWEFRMLSGGDPTGSEAPSFFTGSNTCLPYMTLPAGGSCTYVLGFSPRVAGPVTAELRITDNALDSPQVIHVSGTATAPPPLVPAPPPPPVPAATLSGHPPERTKARAATFTFSGSQDTTRFECRLDKAAFRRCASPVSYRALKPGKHRFWMRPIGTFPSTVLGPAVTYAWRVIGPPVTKAHGRRP